MRDLLTEGILHLPLRGIIVGRALFRGCFISGMYYDFLKAMCILCALCYDNNVHFEGVRCICGPHLVIIGPSEARTDLMAR